MKTKDFYFDLPEELIAQNPPQKRGESRLFIIDRKTQSFYHDYVINIAKYIPQNAIMVFNDSKVRKARIYAKAETGAQVEFLLVKRISGTKWEALCTKLKKRTVGSRYIFEDGITCTVIETLKETRIIEFSEEITDSWLDTHAHMPLPPYIKREDAVADSQRYQTIYAKNIGSSAAPTAGLHFTDEIFRSLDEHGIKRTYVTLHVGLGTFMPVRVDDIKDHIMHEERYEISHDTALLLNNAKKVNQPIVAVGTTSMRTLESSFDIEENLIKSGEGETSIFMYPGYVFHTADHLFTNFHTPLSTLLMLVSAFAGKDLIEKAYQEAIAQKYRFFSYGDAMLIL